MFKLILLTGILFNVTSAFADRAVYKDTNIGCYRGKVLVSNSSCDTYKKDLMNHMRVRNSTIHEIPVHQQGSRVQSREN
jgi:hypothetical protein